MAALPTEITDALQAAHWSPGLPGGWLWLESQSVAAAAKVGADKTMVAIHFTLPTETLPGALDAIGVALSLLSDMTQTARKVSTVKGGAGA